ncbi:hypothetical protein UA08_04395 [Talaromyces atroroseus]|uniref:Signal recognition particle receptor subunit beta n=1 Tax=Talaromyces atroroseus TaxID=1441469 RepID=A0A1Q5Q839_TALAT|nr:hypothetical protein UA08_04395 [Talaromyces atroroseus]OKL60281.1 hypothetical protein UA08_04395 [Talaromyces atroroseus]
MDWSQVESVATTLLDGNPIAIFLALAVALALPAILHWALYRKAASPSLSTFVLLGPSGAGKTAFLTLRSKAAPITHTSQASTSTTVTLPPSVPIFSNRYRSVNDSSLSDSKRNPVQYILKDTPGHGKLRSAQISQLQTDLSSKKEASPTRGIVFFVDAASLSEEAESLRDSASYLYDVLLVLQKVVLNKGKSSSKAGTTVPLLVASNKQDLFTALPPGSVRQKLESEIDRIRKTRQKGLMDASAGSELNEDEDEILGGDDGRESFSFQALEDDIGIKVEVIGGFTKAEDGDADGGAGVRKWEEWIGKRL